MQKFLMWLQMIPAIIALVREIEKAIPASGKGADKLNMVLDAVDIAATASPGVMESIGAKDIQGTVTKIVGVTVDLMNKTGAFPKGPEPEPKP